MVCAGVYFSEGVSLLKKSGADEKGWHQCDEKDGGMGLVTTNFFGAGVMIAGIGAYQPGSMKSCKTACKASAYELKKGGTHR